MKKLYSLLVLCICFGLTIQAQTLSIVGTEATVTGSVPGCLVGTAFMSAAQKATMTKLTINGVIDARDFLVIRDEMGVSGALTSLNLSSATVASYTGTLGPGGTGSQTYPANTIPINGLRDQPRLVTISLPVSVTSIGAEAFYKNRFMTSISMPSSLTTISTEAFMECQSLTSIDLPATLTAINTNAFVNCFALSTIRSYSQNPASITMGGTVFAGVPTTTCILRVPIGRASNYSGTAPWSSFTNIVANLGASANLSMNGTVATITGSTAGCLVGTGLMSNAQKTTTTKLIVSGIIDASDFKVMRDEMSALTQIDLNASTIATYTGTLGTAGAGNLTYLANTIPVSAFTNQIRFTSILMPTNATRIDDNAFADCVGFTSITVPNSIETLGAAVFRGCTNLSSVTLPSSLATLSFATFEKCTSLTTITLPSTLQTIEGQAFYQSGLTSISIPPSVKTIQSSFNECAQLATVTFLDPVNSSLNSIEDFAFAKCTSLQTIEFPSHLRQIGYQAFTQSGLKSFTFYDPNASLFDIFGQECFLNCTYLKAVTFPRGMSTFQDDAFSGCTQLDTIHAYMIDPAFMNYGANLFLNVSLGTCKLRVPEGSMMNYTYIVEWSSFTNTVEGLYPPTIQTLNMTRVGTETARIANELTSIGDISQVWVGTTYGTSPHPVAGVDLTVKDLQLTKTEGYEDFLKNLLPGTTYYARSIAINPSMTFAAGVTYGNEISFTTPTLVINGLAATITGMSAGGMEKDFILDATQRGFIKDLTITGTVNLLDFKTMKTTMPDLQYINLSGTTISEFESFPANTIPDYAFEDKSNLYSFALPSGVTSIGTRAFAHCTSLNSISLPSSLTSINNEAFYDCWSLQTISSHLSSPIDITGGLVFMNAPITTGVLRIPAGSLGSYQAANDWKEFSNIVEGFTAPVITTQNTSNTTATTATGNGTITSFGDVTPIEHGMAWGTSAYPTVSSSDKTSQGAPGSTGAYTSSITGLSAGTTYYARTYITVPASTPEAGTTYGDEISFTTIGVTVNGTAISITAATPGCLMGTSTLDASQKLTTTGLTISGTIDARDFKVIRDEMTALTVIDLSGVSIAAYTGTDGTFNGDFPYTQNDIPLYAFQNRAGITSITLPSTLVSISLGAFNLCSGLTSISIPSTVTVINQIAFSGCSNLTSISIPNSVTTIYSQAFQNCSKLTSVTLPSNLSSISQSLFSGCSMLNNVTIPNTVTTIGSSAFYGCTMLNNITIPTSITSISSSAFRNCTSLTTATIPASVTIIGSSVYNGDLSLTTINSYTNTPLTINNTVFPFSIYSTCLLRVPSGTINQYQGTSYWNFTNIVEGFVKPTITTQAASNIATTSATANATISNFGDVTPIQYGVIWSTSPNPTIDLVTKTTLGVPSTTGAYTSSITGLTGNTTYYVRSYATNTASSAATGTTYGNETSFTTNNAQLTIAVPPTIVLNKIYDGNTTATLTDVGTLAGIQPADITNVTITANAGYSDPSIGTGKTITVVYTLSGPAASKYLAPANYVVTTGEIDKELKVNVILEGLWNSANGNMNQCRQSNFTPMYGSNIADLITIELHNPASYGSILYTFSDLELHQDGSVTSSGQTGIALPPSLTGTYMVTVKTRNHLETASAAGVSFSGISTTYDFRDLVGKAYESTSLFTPTKHISGKWMLYAGDSKRETFYPELNFNDLYDIFNNKSAVKGVYGYLTQDIDGDGDVTDNDLYLMFNNRDVLLYIP